MPLQFHCFRMFTICKLFESIAMITPSFKFKLLQLENLCLLSLFGSLFLYSARVEIKKNSQAQFASNSGNLVANRKITGNFKDILRGLHEVVSENLRP